MAGNTVNILIKADDQASKTIKDVDENAGRLGKTLGQVGTVAGGFLAAEVIGKGFDALSQGINDSIAGFKEQQQVSAQTAAVIKSTGGAAGLSAEQIETMAGALQKSSLFADDTIQSGENLLLTFTNIGKDTFPRATKAMLDMSQAMGQDLGTSAIQIGKALNNPIEGLSALTRVGVTFTDEQKNMVKAMQESGDIAGAQAIILAELEKEFGGSAKAASDAAGASATYADKVDELQDSIGEKLLPVQLKFREAQLAAITYILEVAIPAFQKFMQEHEELFKTIGKVAAAIAEHWGQIKQVFEIAAANVATAIEGMMHIIEGTVEIISGVIDLIDDLIHGRWSELWDDAKKIVQGMLDTVRGAFEVSFSGIIGIFEHFAGDIGGIVDGIRGSIVEKFGEAKDKAVELMGNLKEGVVDKFDDAKLELKRIGQDIVNAVEDVFKRAKEIAGNVWGGIVDVIKAPLTVAIGLINKVINAWNALSFHVNVPGLPDINWDSPNINPIQPLAEGGIVKPRAGGTIARLAEAGQAEAVIPLSRLGGMLGGDIDKRVPTLNVYLNVWGSIRSDRELVRVMRDEFLNGGFSDIFSNFGLAAR